MCWALTKADAATAVSSELKKIIDTLTLDRANSSAIPNGVDMPPFASGSIPQSCRPIVGRQFILTLGRLHRYKGLDVLLQAVKILCEAGTETPYVVIAGDGKEMKNLKTQVRDLALDSKVIFTGTVFGEEKHWLLQNCKFFVQPSRAEGMPLTVLEAMSYGKPVIGTSISGITELIIDKHNGLLVEPNNSDMLSDAITSLIESPRIDQMQHGAKALAAQMTWPVIADRYLDLYVQLLS
jgi:glycosyltransferase involved in cell wall biosynthesis